MNYCAIFYGEKGKVLARKEFMNISGVRYFVRRVPYGAKRLSLEDYREYRCASYECTQYGIKREILRGIDAFLGYVKEEEDNERS